MKRKFSILLVALALLLGVSVVPAYGVMGNAPPPSSLADGQTWSG